MKSIKCGVLVLAVALLLCGCGFWGGAVGTGVGTAVTMQLNNADPDSSNSSVADIKKESFSSAGKSALTSTITQFFGNSAGGIDYKTGELVGGVKNACDGLMTELTLGFGEGIKAFFGAVDDALVYIWG